MALLSVIIPALNEPYLQKTIQDVRDKATGDVEIIVKGGNNMRRGINEAVRECRSEYIMKLDAHCLLKEGFDVQLIRNHKPNWVQVPRRLRLDAEKWEVIHDGREPVDYELILFQNLLMKPSFIWGTPWNERTAESKGIDIDDTMHFQGSCWFMTKQWFLDRNFMDHEHYSGWGQEPEELTFETLKAGGRVVVNKSTYYAHLHKSRAQREWFKLPEDELAQCYAYSYNRWVIEHRDLFETLIDRFMPILGWPENWKKILYG